MTPITFHEAPPKEPKAGDAWYTLDREYDHAEFIAPKHRGKRQIIVYTPGGYFNVYSLAYSQASGYHGEGWEVSGEPHNLTLSPSINLPPHWHGYIRNGQLVDA